MTEPKRWPKRVERYRVDALLLAIRIGELAKEAGMAVLEEKMVKVVILLSDVALAAREIQAMMKDAKRGE